MSTHNFKDTGCAEGDLSSMPVRLEALVQETRDRFSHEPVEQARRLQYITERMLHEGMVERAVRLQEEICLLMDRSVGTRAELDDRFEDARVATAHSLGYAYGAAGRLEEAIEAYKQAIQLGDRLLGSEEDGTIMPRENLAALYRHLGDPEPAIELSRQVLEARLGSLPRADPRTITALHNLGASIGHRGYNTEAEALLREALVLKQQVLGLDHPSTLATSEVLGECLRHLGQHREAIQVLSETLDGLEECYDPLHWRMRSACESLYDALLACGPSEALAECAERRHRLCQTLDGETGPETIIWLNNAGYHRYETGDARRGLLLCLRARQLVKRADEEGGFCGLAIALNIARCRLALHQPDRAVQELRRLRAQVQDRSGLPEGFLGCVLTELGVAHRTLGDLEAARAELQDAVACLKRDLGSVDPKVQRATRELERIEAGIRKTG